MNNTTTTPLPMSYSLPYDNYGTNPVMNSTAQRSVYDSYGNNPTVTSTVQKSQYEPYGGYQNVTTTTQKQPYENYGSYPTVTTTTQKSYSGSFSAGPTTYAQTMTTSHQGTPSYPANYGNPGPIVNAHSFQYTTESSQRYLPPGTQPVTGFPHGIATVYNVAQVPAFLATPEVRISANELIRWSVGSQETPVLYSL